MATIFDSYRVGDQVIVYSPTVTDNNGTYTIAGLSAGQIDVTPPPPVPGLVAPDMTFTVVRNYTGTYAVAGVGDGLIQLAAPSTFPAPLENAVASIQRVSAEPVTEWADWVTLASLTRTQVWNNFVAAQGMYADAGGRSAVSVTLEVQMERLSLVSLAPTGQVETATITLSGSVQDQRADTLESVTAWTGPVRVRARRVTPFDYDFQGTIVDEVKWQDLSAVSPVDKSHFDDLTTIHTITKATERATASRQRQLNVLASRLIPLWTGSAYSGVLDSDGRLVSGTLGLSSRVADIIAAVVMDPKIGARPSDEVDIVQMLGVQAQLDSWSTAAGQFNFTLDSDSMSLEETINLIADAGFCKAYRQSGKIRISADIAQSVNRKAFTHRSKAYPPRETLTRTFANDSEYDGVELQYADPDTEANETITLPLDGSSVRPKKIEVSGIRSFAQAWFRANREWAKLQGQRLAIETQCTVDARALVPGARVLIVDNTKIAAMDGEVLHQEGLMLRLSQPVVFTPGQNHSIVLVKRDGSLEAIPVTAGLDVRQVVLQYAPAEAVVVEYTADGHRTQFSFAADDARAGQAFLVQRIDRPQDGYVTISAVNYSDSYYAADTQPVPDKYSVIN